MKIFIILLLVLLNYSCSKVQNEVASDKQASITSNPILASDFDTDAQKLITQLEAIIVRDNISNEQAHRLRKKVTEHLEKKYSTIMSQDKYNSYMQDTDIAAKSGSVNIWEDRIQISSEDGVLIDIWKSGITASDGDEFISIWDDGIQAIMWNWESFSIWEDWIQVTTKNGESFSIWKNGINIQTK